MLLRLLPAARLQVRQQQQQQWEAGALLVVLLQAVGVSTVQQMHLIWPCTLRLEP
jgi:hypothetical protein